MKLTLFSVLVDTQRLSVGVFKQLEAVPLWTRESGRDASLELVGVVRYKVNGCEHWILAKKAETLVRCSLNPYRKPDSEFETEFATYEKLSSLQAISPTSAQHWSKKASESAADRAAEDDRFDVHRQAAGMVQLFLGLR